MGPADSKSPARGGANRRPARRFAFAPRETDGADTADSVSRDSRRRRLRQIALASVIGAIVVVSIGLVEFDSGEETTVQIGVQKASVDPGGTVSLEGLSYKGVTSSGRNFIVLADEASESTERPDLVSMVSPRARVDTEAGNPITIRSNSGELERTSNTVTLSGKVVIVRPDLGLTLTTEEAFADLASGTLRSEVPVRGTGPDGSIDSGGIVIAGNDGNILFTGRATLVIDKGVGPVE